MSSFSGCLSMPPDAESEKLFVSLLATAWPQLLRNGVNFPTVRLSLRSVIFRRQTEVAPTSLPMRLGYWAEVRLQGVRQAWRWHQTALCGHKDGNFGLAFGAHVGAALAHNLELGINVQVLRDMLLRRAMPGIAPKAPYSQTNGNNAATDYE
jgi:hypothetical protein